MFRAKSFLLMAALFSPGIALATPSGPWIHCIARCSQDFQPLLSRTSGLNPDNSMAFSAACSAQGGRVARGQVGGCGTYGDFWCVAPNLDRKTAEGSASGFSSDEFQIRVEAQRECKSLLPVSSDCSTFALLGAQRFDSVQCE